MSDKYLFVRSLVVVNFASALVIPLKDPYGAPESFLKAGLAIATILGNPK